jgi:ubiquinone biosynthesis protein UbiJ
MPASKIAAITTSPAASSPCIAAIVIEHGMLTQTIENLLNRNLSQSPRARTLCKELKGQRLRVIATGPGWRIEAESLGDSLLLRRDAAGEVHATVEGSPISLLALAGPSAEDVIRRRDVRIGGDAEVAQRYREMLELLRPDVEEELARLIGDSPAHQVLRFARSALAFGERTARTTVRNTAEYFAYESRDLVPRAESEDFFAAVDKLREDLDRLDARLAALESSPQDNAASDEPRPLPDSPQAAS